jgi:hypothetical protein
MAKPRIYTMKPKFQLCGVGFRYKTEGCALDLVFEDKIQSFAAIK